VTFAPVNTLSDPTFPVVTIAEKVLRVVIFANVAKIFMVVIEFETYAFPSTYMVVDKLGVKVMVGPTYTGPRSD
jgi:hypothetical protein